MTATKLRHVICLIALVFPAGLLLSAAGGFSADGAEAPEAAPEQSSLEQTFESPEPYVPGEVVVQRKGEEFSDTVQVPEGADPAAVAKQLQARPNITAASPNYIARASSTFDPNDQGVQPWKTAPAGGWADKQWNFLPCSTLCGLPGASGQKQSRGGINVLGAWKNLRKAGRPGAKGVRIAVIDSGVAYRNYKTRFRKSPDLKRSHIGNGRDFVDNDKLPLDRYGHGTHITSTISEATNNGIGLTGIAYGAKILPVRVLNANGFGTTREITNGVRWAANHHAKVAVMSLNFPCGDTSKVLSDALSYAHSKGVILVASAGNQGSTTCPSLPATGPGVIAVGGSTAGGCLANYSFRSPEIALTAPGGGPGYPDCPYAAKDRPVFQLSMRFEDPRNFAIENRWEGTSMAAAHLAGAAAMVVASGVLTDGTGPRQVRDRLIATARMPDYASPTPDSGFGAGIIDAARATDPAVVTTP